MHSIAENLELIKDYFLANIDIEKVEEYLKVYDNHLIHFEKDFYTDTINSTPENIDATIDLLLHLKIDLKLWTSYFAQDLTLYEFLKKVVKDHEFSIQLNAIIDILEKRKRHNKIMLAIKILAPLVAIVAILAGVFHSQLENIINFLIFTAGLLPVFGIMASISSMIFFIFINHHLNDRRPKAKSYRDDSFIILTNSLNIIAKVLLMVAKYTFAPLAAFFFIAAAIFDVLKEMFYLIELRNTTKPVMSPEDEGDNTNLALYYQQCARQKYDYIKQRNVFLINIAAAFTLAVSVTACAFLPAGILLTAATCCVITIVFLIKRLAFYINDRIISDKLQSELKAIGEQYQPQEETVDLAQKHYRKSIHLKTDIFRQITNRCNQDTQPEGAVRIKVKNPRRSIFSFFQEEKEKEQDLELKDVSQHSSKEQEKDFTGTLLLSSSFS